MKLKSTTYYWMAVIFGGVGMGAAMGAEGTAQTTGYISGTLFAVSLVLILAAVLLARLGFAAEDRERAEASDDIVVRAGYSARANVWEMCAEEMDNVREMLQEESGEITYA